MSKNTMNRRDFMKGAAAGAMSLAAMGLINPSMALAEDEKAVKAKDGVASCLYELNMPHINKQDENTILFRWNSYQFLEFVLPNNKRIIVDPYWYKVSNRYNYYPNIKASEWIDGADYVLLTHVHGDHANDLPDILEHWPKVPVLIPAQGMQSLAYNLGLNVGGFNALPVSHGEVLEFEDFKVEVCRGLHTFASGIGWQQAQLDLTRYATEDGDFKTESFENIAGGRDMMNYTITTKDGWKITLWAGEMASETHFSFYRDTKPDIFFYQNAKVNFGGDRDNPDTTNLAKMINLTDPQVVLPFHQNDSFPRQTVLAHELTVEKLNNEIAEGCGAQIFSPDSCCWYAFTKDADGKVSMSVFDK
ncbi:MAG: MBL fold metallo-hydrolase [Clostridia bacterium]|nr:MBL fold metallo-hydrolase [Clostridia bacterium]